MKVRFVKMRRHGIVIPKRQLANEWERCVDLTIRDLREGGFNRIVKRAEAERNDSGTTELLYEPHILWANEDRFVLTGFERVMVEGEGLTDYAQFWLCKIGWEPPEDH